MFIPLDDHYRTHTDFLYPNTYICRGKNTESVQKDIAELVRYIARTEWLKKIKVLCKVNWSLFGDAVFEAGFRICIDLMRIRIRIQHFF